MCMATPLLRSLIYYFSDTTGFEPASWFYYAAPDTVPLMIMQVYKILDLRYCTQNTQSTPVMLLRLYYAAPETVLLMILQNTY